MATTNDINNTGYNLTVSNGFTVSSGAVAFNTGTSSITVGNDASAKTITLGNTTGATALDINFGTGGFTLASASGNIMVANSAGYINYPLQPSFYYYLGTDDNTITGDGGVYKFGTTGNALTKLYDQGSNCSTLGVFTAPVTGNYQFTCFLRFKGASTPTASGLQFITTPSTATVDINPSNCHEPSNGMTQSIMYIQYITSGSICYVELTATGASSNTIGIVGLLEQSFFCWIFNVLKENYEPFDKLRTRPFD